jgi:phosphoribosyl-ATP pyrophosphohydrolase/phosphoribosyl-AMP cyclohydrolase
MKIDFEKYSDGLVPAVVQDYNTQKVLMLGFMNREACRKQRKQPA